MPTYDIIVIGGSAGSTKVIRQVLSELPEDFDASIFITTHVPAQGSMLADMLETRSKLPVLKAVDGMPVEKGRIYVAAADRHLLLLDSVIRLGHGPRENMSRPSIDPMFRSAAFSYGARVVGVILSGQLNDGVAGLHAIKQCGGRAVVQHPLDAEAESMPRSALESVDIDDVATAAELPSLLRELIRTPINGSPVPPKELELEIRIAAGARVGSKTLRSFTEPSAVSCPDCHGVLSEVKSSGPLRYRCQIGHAYTVQTVLDDQQGQVDEALSIALRLMEERLTLVERMAADAHGQGRSAVAELYSSRADEYRGYVDTLRGAVTLALQTSHEQSDQDV